MISNAPKLAHAAESVLQDGDDRPHGFIAWLLSGVHRSLCALHGHDAILQYERNRIFLRCTSCGHETPGWEVAPNAAALRRRPLETRTPLAAARDLAVARKIA